MSLTVADFPASALDREPNAEEGLKIVLSADEPIRTAYVADRQAGTVRTLRYYLEQVVTETREAAKSGKNIVSRFFSWIWDKARAFGSWVRRTTSKAWNWLKNVTSKGWNWTKDHTRQAWSWIKDKSKRAWSWSKDKVQRAWAWSKTNVPAFGRWIWRGLTNLGSLFVSRPLATIVGGAATAGGLALFGVRVAAVVAGVWILGLLLSGEKKKVETPAPGSSPASELPFTFAQVTAMQTRIDSENAAAKVLADNAQSKWGNAEKYEFSKHMGWVALLDERVGGGIMSAVQVVEAYRAEVSKTDAKTANDMHTWTKVLDGAEEAEAWLLALIAPAAVPQS